MNKVSKEDILKKAEELDNEFDKEFVKTALAFNYDIREATAFLIDIKNKKFKES